MSSLSTNTDVGILTRYFSLTIANQMLSLVGSIQLDPFSPEHVPERAILTSSTNKTRTIPPTASAQEVEMLIEGIDEESDEELPMVSELPSTLPRKKVTVVEPTPEETTKEDGETKKKEKKRKRSEKKESEESKDKKKHDGKKRKKTS